MSDPIISANDPLQMAYAAGRRNGLAISAMAVAGLAFISMLGMEKAILAVVLARLAVRGAGAGEPSRRYSAWATVVACVYAATFAVVLIVFHRQLAELLRLLQHLS